MAVQPTIYDLANLQQVTQGGGALIDYLNHQRAVEDERRQGASRLSNALALQRAENAGGMARTEAQGRITAEEGRLNRANELEKVRLLTKEQFEKLTTAGKIKQIEDFQKAGVTIDPKKSLDEQYADAVSQAKSMGLARVKDFTKSIAGLNKQIQDAEAKDAKQRATLARDYAGQNFEKNLSLESPKEMEAINEIRKSNKNNMTLVEAINEVSDKKIPTGRKQMLLERYGSEVRTTESALQEQDQKRENPEQRRLREQLVSEQRGFDAYTTKNPVGQIGYDHYLQTSGSGDALKETLFGATRLNMAGRATGTQFGPPAVLAATPEVGAEWGDTFTATNSEDYSPDTSPIQDDPSAPMLTPRVPTQFVPSIPGAGVVPSAVNPYLQRINQGIGAVSDAASGVRGRATALAQGARDRLGNIVNRGKEVLFSGTEEQRVRALFGDDAPLLLEKAKSLAMQRGMPESEQAATFTKALSGDQQAIAGVRRVLDYLRMERDNPIQDDPSGPLSVPWDSIPDDPRAPMITPTTPQ